MCREGAVCSCCVIFRPVAHVDLQSGVGQGAHAALLVDVPVTVSCVLRHLHHGYNNRNSNCTRYFIQGSPCTSMMPVLTEVTTSCHAYSPLACNACSCDAVLQCRKTCYKRAAGPRTQNNASTSVAAQQSIARTHAAIKGHVARVNIAKWPLTAAGGVKPSKREKTRHLPRFIMSKNLLQACTPAHASTIQTLPISACMLGHYVAHPSWAIGEQLGAALQNINARVLHSQQDTALSPHQSLTLQEQK